LVKKKREKEGTPLGEVKRNESVSPEKKMVLRKSESSFGIREKKLERFLTGRRKRETRSNEEKKGAVQRYKPAKIGQKRTGGTRPMGGLAYRGMFYPHGGGRTFLHARRREGHIEKYGKRRRDLKPR